MMFEVAREMLPSGRAPGWSNHRSQDRSFINGTFWKFSYVAYNDDREVLD